MANKKQLHNRLDDLFADMPPEPETLLAGDLPPATGWTWKCNPDGTYRACSPEVENILGVRAADFIGQPLISFLLSPEASQKLQARLEKGDESLEITLQYRANNGRLVTTRTNIFRHVPEGWSGFSQVIKETPEAAKTFTSAPTTPPAGKTFVNNAAPPHIGAMFTSAVGFAIDEDGRPVPVSEPYSGAGKQSLKKIQTITNPSAPGVEAALAVPIPMPNQSLGLLEIIDSDPERDWNDDEQRLVEEVANQLALAMENAILFQETQWRAEQERVLSEIVTELNAREDPKTALPTIQNRLKRIIPIAGLSITLTEPSGQLRLYSYTGSGGTPVQSDTILPENTAPAWVIRSARPFVENRINRHESPFGEDTPPHLEQFASRAVFPLTIGQRVVGTLNVGSRQPEAFSPQAQAVLQQVASQMTLAMERYRLFQESQHRSDELALLNEMGQQMTALLDVDAVLEILEQYLPKLIITPNLYVALYEESTNTVAFPIQYHRGERQPPSSRQGSSGLTEYILRTGKTLYLPNNVEKAVTRLEGVQVGGEPPASWLGTPLLIQNRAIGVIAIQEYHIANAYDQHMVELLESIASQAAVAIHNARLYQQAQNRSQQLQTAAEISRVASSILDPNPLIIKTVNLIRERFNLYYVGLFLIDTEGQWAREPGQWAVLRAGTGEAGRLQVERGHKLEVGSNSMIGQCTASGQPQISQQVSAEQRRFANPLLPETRSEMALPLISRGQVIGAMTIQSDQPAAFSQDDIVILQTMADQVANALQNANLFDQIQIRAEELAVLNEMGRKLTSTVDVHEISHYIYSFASRLIDTSTFFIALYEPNTNTIVFPLTVEEKVEIEIPSRRKSKGLTDYVISTREPLLLQDNVDKWMMSQGVDVFLFGNEHISRSWLGVPMLVGGNVIGVISVQNLDAYHYTEQDRDLLSAIANQSAIAFQNASLFAETRQRTDDLVLLNQMSRELSNLLNLDDVIQAAYTYINRLMDTSNLIIGLYDFKEKVLSFPLVTMRGKVVEVEPRKLGRGLSEHVIETRTPLLLNGHDIPLQIQELGLGFIPVKENDTPPKSWLGVPMLIGENVIGIIVVQSITTPWLYAERHRDLLSSIANQVAITIQNTRLFAQIQQRTQEAEMVNRIVAQVAASLDIKESLQVVVDELSQLTGAITGNISLLNRERTTLTLMADYISRPGIPSAAGLELSLDEHPLSAQIITTGKAAIIDNPQADPMFEAAREYAQQHNIKTVMLFPLSVGNSVIGIIELDFTEENHRLSKNEARLVETIILQTTTAIENARLFDRVESALNETQALYEASAALNVVNSFEDILHVLREHTILGKADNNISINIFDRPWRGDDMPEWSIVIARWSQLPPEVLSDRYSLRKFPAAKTLLRPNQATIIEDLHTYTDIDEITRELYIKHFRAGSTIFVPLKIARRWIGYINGIYSQPLHFPEEQIRRLTTISRQATVAIQNIQLLEETRQQLRTLSTLSNASQSFASAPLDVRSVSQIIARIFADVLGGDSSVSVSLIDQDSQDQMITYVSLEKSGEQITLDEHPENLDFRLSDYPATATVMKNAQSLIVQADDPDADPAELAYMKSEKIQTLIILPLIVKGQPIGIIELEYKDKQEEISDDELDLAITLANQAAIALNNAILYDEQRRTAEQLREIDTLKSQFLANMSHELRTPLNSIIGFSRVIMKGIDGPVTDTQQQDLSAIYSAGQHLLNMINDILDISKIEAGKMELAFDEVDVTQIIESVHSTARGLVKDKPVQLIVDLEENLPVIQADTTRVRQILLNLISNAAKFTDQGSITISARQRTNKDGKPELYLAVTDTGSGISQKDQEKLFIPFSQVDGSPTRKVGGTGLGLSITRMLVELHGGEIGVISAEGRGSTFWFTLPVPETSKSTEAHLTVLAIDDDPQVIKLYERYLNDANYQVVAVTDPSLALEQAREVQPFVITLDIMMPDTDGWQLLKDLKSDPTIGHIPVIICSLLEEPAKGIELGAASYLVKPILEDELVQTISQFRPSTA